MCGVSCFFLTSMEWTTCDPSCASKSAMLTIRAWVNKGRPLWYYYCAAGSVEEVAAEAAEPPAKSTAHRNEPPKDEMSVHHFGESQILDAWSAVSILFARRCPNRKRRSRLQHRARPVESGQKKKKRLKILKLTPFNRQHLLTPPIRRITKVNCSTKVDKATDSL
jgi:hypothetical protein